MIDKEINIIGVIYPLPSNALNNILNKSHNIFVKYVPFKYSKKTKLKLSKNMTLFLYESKNEKQILGEAKILKIEFEKFDKIIKHHIKYLMLNKEEFTNYCKGRFESDAMLLHLTDIKKYINPIKLSKPITMGGIYVTEQNKIELMGV